MTTLTMPQPAFAPTRRREEPAMSDFVEQKLFASEVKRIDSSADNIAKAWERELKNVDRRFETLEKQMDGLRTDIGDLRRLFITLYLTGLGVTLAAFYAFASYIKG